MNPVWVNEIQQKCDRAQVPFFFKQWGGVQKHRNGRTLNGEIYNGMPALAV